MKSIKIRIPNNWAEELAKDHSCSTQTVRMSLAFVSNSARNLAIRIDARNRLIAEANKVNEKGEYVG